MSVRTSRFHWLDERQNRVEEAVDVDLKERLRRLHNVRFVADGGRRHT